MLLLATAVLVGRESPARLLEEVAYSFLQLLVVA